MGWGEKLSFVMGAMNSVLAIKIDIVLQTIMNSSSSADIGEEGTNDLKPLSEFC